MKYNNLILPISILLGCIILGGFYYASQLSKQKSIEKQQQIELQVKSTQRDLLNKCLADAKNKLSTFIKNSCTSNNIGDYNCDTNIDVEPFRKQVNDECFRLYPPNN